MWAVGPLVSLIAVSLNGAQPAEDQLVAVCDVMQPILVALFAVTAILFGWLHPHRSLLRSFLSSFSSAHNALVTLLGMLARQQRVEQDTVLVVAAIGSYTSMVLGVVVVCIGFLEQRLLQSKRATVRSTPQRTTLLIDTTGARIHSGTIESMRRAAALASLVACACQTHNNESGGHRLL
ncbi:membrane-associated protein, putative [Bodo saltans]|uniref:Membrane-associated protein, putative n=1 Tax=Bodo saltans TaxID=75058 RepID=A0A0S4J2S7_BODSA|nr:membrane-associated protein, putative [Bodo saltans]|eukprot:CUG71897.1 membrane-associated protein, putative [Bodo saltans]